VPMTTTWYCDMTGLLARTVQAGRAARQVIQGNGLPL